MKTPLWENIFDSLNRSGWIVGYASYKTAKGTIGTASARKDGFQVFGKDEDLNKAFEKLENSIVSMVN